MFLKQTYYGNTVLEWLIGFAIIIGSIVLGRFAYWVLNKFVKRLTKKTKTRLDFIIIDMIEEPIFFSIIILGIWVSLRFLNFPDNIRLLIGKTYYILIVFNVAWLITRLFNALIEEYLVPLVEKTEDDLDDLLLPIVRKGIKVAIWVTAIIVGLNNAGYDVGALLAGLGIGGLAFALAAQDSISNIFGGFTIFVDKPFKINDRIRVHGFDGTIKEIGLRSTRLVTLEGRTVTIPNSKFSGDAIENISSEPARKVKMVLGLTYDTSPEQIEKAIKILKDLPTQNKHIRKKIVAIFDSFGDFSLNILFIYYIKKSSDIFETQSEINLEILKQFNAEKLDFAFPTQTIIAEKV